MGVAAAGLEAQYKMLGQKLDRNGSYMTAEDFMQGFEPAGQYYATVLENYLKGFDGFCSCEVLKSRELKQYVIYVYTSESRFRIIFTDEQFEDVEFIRSRLEIVTKPRRPGS